MNYFPFLFLPDSCSSLKNILTPLLPCTFQLQSHLMQISIEIISYYVLHIYQHKHILKNFILKTTLSLVLFKIYFWNRNGYASYFHFLGALLMPYVRSYLNALLVGWWFSSSAKLISCLKRIMVDDKTHLFPPGLYEMTSISIITKKKWQRQRKIK